MPRVSGLARLVLCCLASQALALYLKVQNNCPFEVYCSGAKNDRTFTDISTVPAGARYQSQLTGANNNIGTVVKCALNSYIQHPFQMEVTVSNGATFLDLSAVDGDPFLSFDRYAEVDGGLCAIDCPAHTKSCEWPYHTDCLTTDDLTMYLCSHPTA
ncbi:hypothetical protein F5Y08DRAFT_347414 [Xylaria arbuscula]|nr:hypothetical protein F5Y08DRAFT_347414 [Xylaria arbuscula]